MKRGLLCLLLLIIGQLQAETIVLKQSRESDGLRTSRSSRSGLNLTFSMSSFEKNETEIRGEQFHTIGMKGVFLPANPGEPNLPILSRYVAIPKGATVTARVKYSNFTELSSVRVSPSPEIPRDSDDSRVTYPPIKSSLRSAGFYPAQVVSISDPIEIRGVQMVSVSVHPFQYDMASSRLKAYDSIELELNFSGGSRVGGDTRLQSEWWDQILRGNVINPEIIEPLAERSISSRGDGCDYLIISANDEDFIAQANRIQAFRNAQGIHSKVVTISDIGGNDDKLIKEYIHNAYKSWDPAPSAVLLIGDYGTDNRSITMPYAEGYCISDNIYADVNNDLLPDMVFARMPANTVEELTNIVDKVINFEKAPTTDAGFYNEPLVAMGWQTERWFQIFGEVTYRYFKNELELDANYEYYLYEGSPKDGWSTSSNTETIMEYFGSKGLGYIPDEPTHLSESNFTGDAEAISEHINNGSFLVIHRDHGMVSGWGDPEYLVSDVLKLQNDELPVVLSLNCNTGKFDEDNKCFAEAFIQHKQGAVGILAATNFSWSWVNDTYGWGMIDYIWQDFLPDYPTEKPESGAALPAFASVYGKIFLSGSSWPCNPDKKAVTYALFHYLGDAFTQMHTEVPTAISLSCDATVSKDAGTFTVTAESGAKVALSQKGRLIAVKNCDGSSVTFDIPELIPGEELLVTATKKNAIRTEKKVTVSSGSSGYIKMGTVEVTGGDGNGSLDYNETVSLKIGFENAGGGTISGFKATLRSEDPYVTITDSVINSDALSAGSSVTKEGFSIDVSDIITNKYSLSFTLAISEAGGKERVESFRLTALAPEVVIDSLVYKEVGNSNGLYEAGEKANVTLFYTNKGSSMTQTGKMSGLITAGVATISGDISLKKLASGVQDSATFVITIANNFDLKTGLVSTFDLLLGKAKLKRSIALPVDRIFEDFETGDFSKLKWYFVGDSANNWSIVTPVENMSGKYCVQAAKIDHSQMTGMAVDLLFPTAGQVSFDFNGNNSQWARDFMSFHIDGNLAGEDTYSWSSGTKRRITIAIPEGQHTLMWKFQRNDQDGDFNNTPMIDNIEILFGGPEVGKSEVVCSVEKIDAKISLTNDELKTFPIRFTNNGVEASQISAELVLYDNNGDVEVAPEFVWDEQFKFEMPTPNTGLYYKDNALFTSRWSDSRILKWDLKGNPVDTIEVSGVNSLRALTWDGEYFYGVNRTRGVFKIDGEKEEVIDRLILPDMEDNPNGIAYDEGVDGFWVHGYNSASAGPLLVDRNMQVLGGAHMLQASHYDVAFDNITPGGPYLWIVQRLDDANGDANASHLRQFHIPSQRWTEVNHKISNETTAGIYVTDQYAKDTVTVIAYSQGDTLRAFNICETRIAKVTKNRSVIIPPKESRDLEITLDCARLKGVKSGVLRVTDGTQTRGYREIPLSFEKVSTATTMQKLPMKFTLQSAVRRKGELFVQFYQPTNSASRIALFDMRGRVVRSLSTEELKAGFHTLTLDVEHMASGMYIFQMQHGTKLFTQKLVFSK